MAEVVPEVRPQFAKGYEMIMAVTDNTTKGNR
jgi:hypothetical protein